MLSLAFGLPMPDEKKIDALAVAWARFQQEYPGTKMSRKMAVVIDLATSVGVTYFPLFAMIMLKAKQAAEARRKPSSGVVRPAPTQNPPHRTDGGTSGSESIRRTTPTGSELVLMSGVVPDKGHLDFGPS